MPNKFSLENNRLYKIWRNQKLAGYPLDTENLMTNIADAHKPKPAEINRILSIATHYNMALYRLPIEQQADKNNVHQLANICGLKNINHNLCADTDSLTSIQVSDNKEQRGYIPYTKNRLSWHTDGYYNQPDEQIYGMLLHCVRPALSGGDNGLMDHEIAYILLREADPAYIEALQHPQALTIPANYLNGEIIRPEQTGPVFSVTPQGKLHMRYSARQRNIKWRDNPSTYKATRFLRDLWEQDSPYKINHTLQAGEGVLCNNILHCRTGFVDHESYEQKRLLFRGRYTQHLTKTL